MQSPSPTKPASRLDGLNVLIVEDSYLVAESLAQILTEAGATVVGPVPRAEDAHRLIEERTINAALLDVKLAVGNTMTIAQALQARECPFAFVTGYGSPALPEDAFREVPVLRKPVNRDELLSTLSRLIAAADRRHLDS